MYHRPKLLFSSSATHTASLEDCLMDESLIWLLSAWVPPNEAEVIFHCDACEWLLNSKLISQCCSKRGHAWEAPSQLKSRALQRL